MVTMKTNQPSIGVWDADEPKKTNKPMKDEKALPHLEWIYERMRHVHGENENVDYMIRFREILEQLKTL
jgi:hypothetical protein